jgi:hypothetical protein
MDLDVDESVRAIGFIGKCTTERPYSPLNGK